MSWTQSVDQALCFGWIDGIRRTIDDVSYCIRFTPRRANSIWSEINIKKVKALSKAGLMTEDGLAAFSKRKRIASKKEPNAPTDISSLDGASLKTFKHNSAAWNFFKKQSQSYKKLVITWIMSAKKEETKRSRLKRTILSCEQGKK